MLDAPDAPDWLAMSDTELPVNEAVAWVIQPQCGAVVTFLGTVRDHSEGRTGVTHLEYEAYAEQVEPRLRAVAEVARVRWPMIGRVALLHRIGRLEVGETSVVVAVSTPNRPESFAAGRFLIDTVKAAVPIWKHETWSGGADWSVCDHEIDDLDPHGDAQVELLAEIDRLSGLTDPDRFRAAEDSVAATRDVGAVAPQSGTSTRS